MIKPTAALALMLSACGRPEPRSNDQELVLRRTQAFVVPPNRVVPADELAAAVRATGYPCATATAFAQLEVNGKALDNYKLDCGDRSYLITWLDGGSRIRPWSDQAFK
jgi:hypothetical protein